MMSTAQPGMAYSLSVQERRALAVIQDFVDSGIGPTIQQIAGALGTTKSGAHRLATQLQAKGWIRRLPNTARSITLIHRLAPAPGQALAQLLTALLKARPSEGYVHVSIPLVMIEQAAQAFGLKREA
jgi:DNA-binding MarR family transcriptional regulator